MSLAQTSVDGGWFALADRYGLPLVGMVFMFFGFRWLYLRAVADRDRERERVEALEEIIRSDFVPAIIRATEAVERSIRVWDRAEQRLDRE